MIKVRATAYKKVIKPVLFRFSPDVAHAQVLKGLTIAGSVPWVAKVVRKVSIRRLPELEIDWQGMHFSSPVGLSAGLDKNGRIVPMMQALGFGFSEVGSVTADICKGNEKPWFYRLPKTESLVVHVGLANEGVNPIVDRLEKLPQTIQSDFPKILSIARTNSKEASGVAEGIKDYIASAQRAKKSPAIQMIEINISCPNAHGGRTFTTPELLEKLLKALDAVKVGKPTFIKMPIDLSWAQTKELLDVIVRHHVTGVTMTNLTKERSLVDLKDDLPDSVEGSISGSPVRERSTEMVRRTYRSYGDKLTIIGVGGVMSAEHAYEKIKAGASFVELITGLIMNGPQFVEEVNRGLAKLLEADGYEHVWEAIGADA